MSRLPLYVGGGILAATTNATILATGGYLTSHAPLVIALSAGVFAGAVVIGSGKIASKGLALAIVAALVSGEAYNLVATGERLVIAREASQAPLRELAAKRQAAIDRLKALEAAEPSSARLALAQKALAEAKAAVEKEAKDIRCGKECKRKQELADRAAADVKAAIPDAVAEHAAALSSAKAEVEANPVPPSATPFADRLGVAPWVLDLVMAALLSVGANGLAGALIAFGSHVPPLPGIPGNAVPVPAMPIPGNPFPGNDPPTGRRGRKPDPRIVNFSEKFRERHGRSPSGSEIKSYFPDLPTSTAYDYAKRA